MLITYFYKTFSNGSFVLTMLCGKLLVRMGLRKVNNGCMKCDTIVSRILNNWTKNIRKIDREVANHDRSKSQKNVILLILLKNLKKYFLYEQPTPNLPQFVHNLPRFFVINPDNLTFRETFDLFWSQTRISTCNIVKDTVSFDSNTFVVNSHTSGHQNNNS